jgi:hypothetical protein
MHCKGLCEHDNQKYNEGIRETDLALFLVRKPAGILPLLISLPFGPDASLSVSLSLSLTATVHRLERLEFQGGQK